MDSESLVVDALTQLGIESRLLVGAPGRDVDLVLDPDGVAIAVQVKRRSLVTEEVARRLFAESASGGGPLLVVADRVTETAREFLTSGRAGYLDLRGRLALRTDRLVIDAEVQPVKKYTERSGALNGKAGLEVATAILMQTKRRVGVRELARELSRSPSTVSEVLAALRRDGMIDATSAVSGTELFWRVADHWPTRRTLIAALPAPGDASLTQPLRLGLDDVEHVAGWALTDSAAATAYGAPLPFRSGQVLDFFVPDQSIARRAATLLGTATTTAQARMTLRVAPVPAAVKNRVDLDTNPTEWPLAHPLFVALDLARDVDRGRAILDAWTPDERWTRVW